MSSESELFKEFKVVRFQPHDIILVHKNTKKAYQYHELQSQHQINTSFQNPYLQRPIAFGKGLLYPKAYKTLQTELQSRKRAYDPIIFSEEEIINTFLPLLECLRQLHHSNIIHGNIDKKAIIMDENGTIKLRDWLVKSQQTYYYPSNTTNNKTKKDDYRALGLIILECINLKMSKGDIISNSIEKIIEPVVNNFSKLFILSLMVLVKKIQNHYHELGFCLGQRPNSEVQFSEIKQLELSYLKIKEAKIMIATQKLEQSRKKYMGNSNNLMGNSNNLMGNSNSLMGNTSLQFSPQKKFMISNTSKKSTNSTIIKLEQCQNRRNDDVKKKHIEKITKIIERSNAFVNELMARRTTADGKLNKGKLNLSLYSSTNNQNNNMKRTSKDSIKVIGGSPSKRVRVIPKKK